MSRVDAILRTYFHTYPIQTGGNLRRGVHSPLGIVLAAMTQFHLRHATSLTDYQTHAGNYRGVGSLPPSKIRLIRSCRALFV
jgi:hypothetical protein